MMKLLVLAALAATALASSSSSSSDSSASTTALREARLAGKFAAQRAAYSLKGVGNNAADVDKVLAIAIAKARLDAFKSDSSSSSSSSSSGSSSSSSGSSSSASTSQSEVLARRDERDARRIQEALAAQAAAELEPFPKKAAPSRKSYQAKFRDCINSPVYQCGLDADEDLEDPETLGKYGPAVIIGKASQKRVTDDSFDGDNDGKLDVAAARDVWAASNGLTQRGVPFVTEIRNRAKVRGGSIDLRSIVITGKNPEGEIATFYGDLIIISPCFSVIFEQGFNVEIYVGTVGFGDGEDEDLGGDDADVVSNTLVVVRNPECEFPAGHINEFQRKDNADCAPFDAQPWVDGSYFWTVQPNGEPAFVDQTRDFVLEREVGAFAGLAEGLVYFEACTQFSYFA